MFTLAIVLVCVVGYLYIGIRFASRPFVTNAVEDTIRRCPNTAKDPNTVEGWRREAAFFSFGIACIWPFYLLTVLFIDWVADTAPLTNYELEQRVQSYRARIKELERELSIGK